MSQLKEINIRKSAKENKPIEYKGLLIYPLTVAQYEIFVTCESVLTLRMSALPAVYAMQNYMQAIFQLNDKDEIGGQYRGSFAKFITLLLYSLRIEEEGLEESIAYSFQKNDSSKIASIIVKQKVGDEQPVVRLESSDVDEVRKIIAGLNGLNVPDESENAELIQADADARQSDIELDYEVDDLIATVARDQRIRMSELSKWTIYEFELIRKAIEREREFTICGTGEMSGNVRWSGGNPYPSVFFNRKRQNKGIVDADSFRNRVSGAIDTSGELPQGANLFNK